MNFNKRKILPAAVCALLALSLTACGGKTVTNSDGTKTVKTERGIKVTQTAAKAVQTEKYETADFSITIPKGWKVAAGGANIYHTIRVTDPNEPLNGMYILLKAECLLHSQAGKAAYQSLYNTGNTQLALFANAVVLENPSTENFFKIFSAYGDFASKMDSTYAGFTFPRYDNFTVTDRFASNSNLKAYSLGEEILRATFTDGGKEGEGMFSASVVDFGSSTISDGTVVGYQLKQADGGYYMAYNIMAVTAAKDTFVEWEGILTESLGTLEYSENFVNATIQAGQEVVQQAMDFSRNANEVLNGIMSSWKARDTSVDIQSQKQSDATLGYERVYDTETGDIYRAENGWSDSYSGERYQPVTEDEMYVQPISGYIE